MNQVEILILFVGLIVVLTALKLLFNEQKPVSSVLTNGIKKRIAYQDESSPKVPHSPDSKDWYGTKVNGVFYDENNYQRLIELKEYCSDSMKAHDNNEKQFNDEYLSQLKVTHDALNNLKKYW